MNYIFLLRSQSRASYTSTWTTRTLKLTRTKREQMSQWMCHRREREKKRPSATTRFTQGCLPALLFRFTYFKTCVSKGKHSRGQAFSIDHLSMQAAWPSTNHAFTFPTYFVAAQLIVSNFTWNMCVTCKQACVHYLQIKCYNGKYK